MWVTTDDIGDRDGLMALRGTYFSTGVKRLKKLWVDGGYSGEALKAWVADLKRSHNIDVEVVGKQGAGFSVLPRRWVVERTYAWLLNFRRIRRITSDCRATVRP